MGGKSGFFALIVLVVAFPGCDTQLAGDLDAGVGGPDVPQTVDMGATDSANEVLDDAAADGPTPDCLSWATDSTASKCTAAGTGPWCQNRFFGTAMLFPVEDGWFSTTGDFDSDGFLDLAWSTPKGVTVVLSQTIGLTAPSSYPTTFAGPLVAGDFNADGKVDLAAAGDNGLCYGCTYGPCVSEINVFLGNGDGTFNSPLVQSGALGVGGAMVTADFTGDGVLDLASTGGLMVGNGNGTFGQPAFFNAIDCWPFKGVDTADFNADGIPDLLIEESPLAILLGKGKYDNGTFFTSPVLCSVPGDLVRAAVGDFNADGILDFVATSQPTKEVSVVLGNGQNGKWDGTCAAPVVYPGGIDLLDVNTGDFNCDGILDIAIVDLSGFHTRWGNGSNGVGDGTFGPEENILGGEIHGLATGDFDKNGVLDIVINNSVLLSPIKPMTTYGVEPVVIADFNSDGVQDLAAVSGYSVNVLLGNGICGGGPGTFGVPTSYYIGSIDALAAADLNGDTILDLIVASGVSHEIKVLLGNGSNGKGDGTFGFPVGYPAGGGENWSWRVLATSDFNSDGVVDIAFGKGTNGPVPPMIAVMLGNGSGGFGSVKTYTWGSLPWDIATGDFNADGIVDLVVANGAGTQDVGVMLGNGTGGKGDGTFGTVVKYPAGDHPSSVVVHDFNGDGIQDLAVSAGSGVSVLLGAGTNGKGNGTFAAPIVYGKGAVEEDLLELADVNSDGTVDLVVLSKRSTTVLLGSGGGKFLYPVTHLTGPAGAVGDLNSDSIPDLVGSYGNDLNIVFGTGGKCK